MQGPSTDDNSQAPDLPHDEPRGTHKWWDQARTVINAPTISIVVAYNLLWIPFEPTGLGYRSVDDPNSRLQVGLSFALNAIVIFLVPRLRGLAWLERVLRSPWSGNSALKNLTPREFRVAMTLFAFALFVPAPFLAVRGIQLFREIGCPALEPNNWCRLYSSVFGKPASYATAKVGKVAVLTGETLALYDAQAKFIAERKYSSDGATLRCVGYTAVLLYRDNIAAIKANHLPDQIESELLSKQREGCLKHQVHLTDAMPTKSGKVCLVVTDGLPDTSPCEETFRYSPVTGDFKRGCTPASLPEPSALSTSPSGRYTVEFNKLTLGRTEYYGSATLTDRSTQHTLVFDTPLLVKESHVSWLPEERAVVFAGSIVSLPDLEPVVRGAAACTLDSPFDAE